MSGTELLKMNWIDYIIFIVMLSMSAVIGLYHGFKKKKENVDAVEEYLFAGRNIPVFPVVLSNMASSVSSIGQVLVPAEVYHYGAQLAFLSFGDFLGYLVMYFFFLPVFYHLKYTSLFQYLEMRFNRTTRILGSAIYTITQILYALIIMYSSCLAISKAIPVPFYVLTSILCIFCTIYTAMGGLRGVVWSDFLQSLFMYASLLTIIMLTINNVGGVREVIEIADNGGRLDMFNFDPNPMSAYSVWLIILSSTIWTVFRICTNPGIMQRHLSLPNYNTSRRVALYSGLSMSFASTISAVLGIVLYATYHDSDPVLCNMIKHSDQLVPYHVMNLSKSVPGLTGMFLAGIVSAALSSLSTILNSLSGIIFDDFIKPFGAYKWSDQQIGICMKSIVFVIGLVITAGIFALEPSSGGFQLFRTITSLTAGFIVFIFGIGLFYRNANEKNALIGAIAGVVASTWIGIGSQNALSSGRIKYVTKIISADNCIGNISDTLNITISGSADYNTPVIFADDVPYVYRISINLILFTGILISVTVCLIVSMFTRNNKDVDDALLVPQIRDDINNCASRKCSEEYVYTKCELTNNTVM